MKAKILLGCALATLMFTTSCNDALDMNPISQITPETYYQNADQVRNYMNNYYNSLITGPYTNLYHQGGWNDGMASSDANTDIFISGADGNTTLFADGHWQVGNSEVLRTPYGNVRAMNFIINRVEGEGQTPDATMLAAVAEAHFLRAMTYFNLLVKYGDTPIVKEVLDNTDDAVIGASNRAPRTEVADFILEDLDQAIANLPTRSAYSGQRINKEAAQVFASRVALFEATFEKYHKGSGRVPGDSNWPGAAFNNGSFDIDGHVKTLLNKAMAYAKPVADAANLTENSHALDPAVGITAGWNEYFEMYSTPSLAGYDEVLLWKQYSLAQSLTHDVPYRTQIGCNDGYTRNFVQSFVMKNGLPIYADNSGYQGDANLVKVTADRDERLQLFVWSDYRLYATDADAPSKGMYFGASITKDESQAKGYPNIIGGNAEVRCVTGYQPRKYFSYDFQQTQDNDQLHGTNACPVFRTAEALVNYMEACVELNGSLDTNAKSYWQALRARAGVSTDVDATVAATDLDKEYDGGNGDFGVYSGTTQVSKLLYNVRRERLAETFSEGLRRMDLVRWRSYDNMLTKKWIPEGMNFWVEQYANTKYFFEEVYKDGSLVADGTGNASVSRAQDSNYLRPWSKVINNNELYDGCNWHQAYYLYPLGVNDLRLSSADRDVATSVMYQNLYWPSSAGGKAEK